MPAQQLRASSRGEEGRMESVDLTVSVTSTSSDPTIRFAARELKSYLTRMTGQSVVLRSSGSRGIRLGLIGEFAQAPEVSVEDPTLDDAIYIDVSGGSGVIAGINPRSVLLAVYRYLTELGCRWVRPGEDGEFVPRVGSLRPVKASETPSYRHRGICIEGAVSEEHVRNIVDWAPKLGFNAYYIQFREAHTFFDRWYSHETDPAKQHKSISIEKARRHTAAVVREIKKRGMVYHAVGHGWTCEPFGISGLGWEQSDQKPTKKVRQYLAQVNGKRELWGGIALNTNLCYGNPEVRRLVTEEIANYAQAHPEIDIMHFWLADGSNNNCECELCTKARPSDFYVMMLNELDALLTKRGLATKIVFLIYVDLLWPPEREKIANPDRFILMFAPITRTYSKSFATDAPLPKLPPFERNKLEFPHSVEENLAFLKAWQKGFPGDSFDFDYHMMWDHFKDLGYAAVADILAQDMRGLRNIGINGMVSVQVQRAFFPSGLPMTAMGRVLWDRDVPYTKVVSDYYASAFGPDGKAARKYLEKLTELFDPVYIRGEKPAVDPAAARRFRKIEGVISRFRPTIERNAHSESECWEKSWDYLRHHAAICETLAPALEARARGDKPAARAAWEETKQYALANEAIIHPALDVYFFVRILGALFE